MSMDLLSILLCKEVDFLSVGPSLSSPEGWDMHESSSGLSKEKGAADSKNELLNNVEFFTCNV